jgi:hypothetical protein
MADLYFTLDIFQHQLLANHNNNSQSFGIYIAKSGAVDNENMNIMSTNMDLSLKSIAHVSYVKIQNNEFVNFRIANNYLFCTQ